MQKTAYCGVVDELGAGALEDAGDALDAAGLLAGAAEDEAVRKTLALALAIWSAVGDEAEVDDGKGNAGNLTGA